jgi:hypothetical protein
LIASKLVNADTRSTTMEDTNMNGTGTRKADEQQRYRSRKIVLDCDLYCLHSMRESDGDPDCDHDFEVEPNVQQASFAIWNCTVCGRAFRFDVWN